MERQEYDSKEQAIDALKNEYPLSLNAFGKGFGFKVSYIPFKKGIQSPVEVLRGKLRFSLGLKV